MTVGGDFVVCVRCVSVFVVEVMYEPPEYGRIGAEVDGIELLFPFIYLVRKTVTPGAQLLPL